MPQTLKKYGVYFDESERMHPDKTRSAYAFTAAVLEESRRPALEKQLTKLRKEMTREVLRIVPHLENHPKIIGGQLIEIHAVDLYQSGGIFREVKRVQKDFWPQQHEWLRQCLEYSSGMGVQYFSHTSSTQQHNQIWGVLSRQFESLCKYVKYQSIKDNLYSLAKNPYFTSLPIIISAIDDYLISREGLGKIYCHTNQDAKNFSTLDSFEFMRNMGHYTHLGQPEFQTCSQRQIIQSADTAGYVILQLAYSREFDTELKKEFLEWARKYVLPNWVRQSHHPTQGKRRSMASLIMEFQISNTGGPAHFQDAVKRTLPGVVQRALDGDNSPWFLTEDGVVLGDPQTNKPPSEDGDLYD